MSRETRIELDVRLESRDFVRANYWFVFRKVRFALLLIFFGGVVYPLLLIYHVQAKGPSDNYWGLLIPAGLLLLVLVSTYFGARRQMASNKSLQQTLHYTFSRDGIDAVAPLSSGHNDWSHVREAFETRNNFLLFISRNLMFVIPKRCFKDSEQIAAFKSLLVEQLSSKAKLKRT
jgi:hypothetical protein